MKTTLRVTTLTALLLTLASHAIAQEVPHTINFQSVLRNDNGDLITDNFIDMQIQILDQGGNPIYAEAQPGVLVVRGAVNIMIGEGVTPGTNTPTGGVPTDALDPNTGSKSLQVQFGSNQPIGPIALGSVPYAMYSEVALNLDPNFADINIPGTFASQAELDAAVTNLQTQITNEAASRATADTTLQNNINNEATTRASADTNLQNQLNNVLTTSTTFGGDVTGTYNNIQIVGGSISPTDINSNPGTAGSTSQAGLTPFAAGEFHFSSSGLVSSGRNVNSAQGIISGIQCSTQPNSRHYSVTFTTPAPSTNYVVVATRKGTGGATSPSIGAKTEFGFQICNGSGDSLVLGDGTDFIVFVYP